MTVEVTYNSLLQVDETFAIAHDLVSDNPVGTHEITGSSASLDADSSPPCTKAWSDQVQLAAGALTLDLAALNRGSLLSAENFTGLKVQVIKIKAPDTNTATVSIAPGATNGYHLFGAADGKVHLGPGDECLFKYTEQLPDVAAGAKDIALASAQADALLQIILVAG